MVCIDDSAMNRCLSVFIFPVTLMAIFVFCAFYQTPFAYAQSGQTLLASRFTEDFAVGNSTAFTASGSAFINQGDGLVVNEPGKNLALNPDFENGSGSWGILGNATMGQYSIGGFDGDISLQVSTVLQGDGIVLELPADGSSITGRTAYTFSFYARSASAESANQILLSLGTDTSGTEISAPVTLGPSWQRYSIMIWLESDYASMTAKMYSSGELPASFLVDDAQIENRSYLTPYFDGDSSGSSWAGTPHSSASIRNGGFVRLENSQIGLDASRPFWFAIDTTIGFNRYELMGSDPTGSKDFVNMGRPREDARGMLRSDQVILDYYSPEKRITIDFNDTASISFITPDFHTGDTIRLMGVFNPEHGIELWAKVGDNPVFHGTDTSEPARNPATDSSDWLISVSDSLAWLSFGNYQDNSTHRDFIIMQDQLGEEVALAYMDDPRAVLSDSLKCGADGPSLSLAVSGARWASYADYQLRRLKVDYIMTNAGVGYSVLKPAAASSATARSMRPRL